MNRPTRRSNLPVFSAGTLALAVVAAALSGTAGAVDGVLEINQARAEAGGISPGDGPGFPVFLNAPGSYRLTSDLRITGVDAIAITVGDVTLDLNGFNIVGGPGALADGVSVQGVQNVEIRNGTIRGFTRHGVFTNAFTHFIRLVGLRVMGNGQTGAELQGQGNLVDGCTAIGNLGSGIRALDSSLVINSVARDNTFWGLSLGPTTGYRSNVLTGNNSGNANAQVGGGGLQLGSNVCGSDLVCP